MLRVTSLLILAATLFACAPDQPVARLAPDPRAPDPALEAVEDRGPLYSPWVVRVSDERARFSEISFKDVGMMSVPEAERADVYEAIAESLAVELGHDEGLSLPGEVHYSEAMSDPSNHLSCAARHVYVDLWDGTAPSRWGYSLWSGCGDEDQFAWREIARPRDSDAAIASLTRSIASSLRDAVRTGCYTRQC